MSPERLNPRRFGFKDGQVTKESDCYAFGMVILEVLTSRHPFPHYSDITVVRKVIDGERPMRPQGPESVWFTDDLWGMLERCWSPQPRSRPTAEVILEHLKRASMTCTEKRIALIAQGTLDPERALQLLDEIFDSLDYLTVLCDYSEAQQYIDGLHKVHCSCFANSPSCNPC